MWMRRVAISLLLLFAVVGVSAVRSATSADELNSMLLSVDSRLAADASAVAPPMPVNSASMDFGKASQQVTQTLTGMLRELQPAPTKGSKGTKAGSRGKRAGSKPKKLIKRKQPVVVKTKRSQNPAAGKSKATVSKSKVVAASKVQVRVVKAGAVKKQTKAPRSAAVKPIVKHVVSKHAQRTVVIIPTQKRQRRTSNAPTKAGQRKTVTSTKKKTAPKPSSGRVAVAKLGNVHHDLLLPSSSFVADTKDARLARDRALREHRHAAQQLKELLRPAAPVQSVHHEYPRPPTALDAINEESNQMESALNAVLSKVGNGLKQHLCQTGVDCSKVTHSTTGKTIKAPARVAVTMPPVVPAATLPPPPNQADAIAAGLHATERPTAPPHVDRGIKDETEAMSCPDRTLLNRASGYRYELGVLRRKLKDETSLGASEARLAFIQARIDRYHDKLESVLRKCHKKAFAATLSPPSTQQVLAEALTTDARTLRKMRTRRVKQVSSDDRVHLDHVSEVATPEQVKKLAIFESSVTKADQRDFEKRMSQMGSILKRNAPPAPILLGIESERLLIDGGGVAAPVKTASKPAAKPATKPAAKPATKPTVKKASVTKSSTTKKSTTSKPAAKATAKQTTVTKTVSAPRANSVPATVQSALKTVKQQVIQPSTDSTTESSSTDSSSSESDSAESFWPPEALQLMNTFQTKLKQHVQTIVPPTAKPSAAAASNVNAVRSIPQAVSVKSVASSNQGSAAGSGSGKKAAATQQQSAQSKSKTQSTSQSQSQAKTQSQSTAQSQTRQSAKPRQSSSSRIASASNAQSTGSTSSSTDTAAAATQSPKKVAFSSYSKTSRLSSSVSGVSAVSKVDAGSTVAPAAAPQQTAAPNLGFSTYVKFNADGSLTMSALMWTLFIAAILGVVVAIALALRRSTVVRRWLGLEDADEQYQSMKQMSGDEAYHQAVMSVLDTAAGVNAKQAAVEATERQRLSASASDSVASAMRPKAIKIKAPQQSVFASWGWGSKPQHASLYDN